MSAPPTSAGQATSVKGRAKACTACRQVKLRCDAREKAPASCSRCEAQGLECKMDPTFKRVPARRALEEVSNRLNHLQRSLGLDQNLPASAGLEDYMRLSHRPEPIRQLPLPGGYTSSISDASSPPDDYSTSNPGPTNFLMLVDEYEEGSWTLGDVTFNADQVRLLFKHFDESHYKHGPFLEPCTSLHGYYKESELLFWTVCMTACFVFNEFDQYHYKLIPHHRLLLSSKMMGDRVTLKTVHAMLCMATWTYPVSAQYDDLTWMLCGAAIHMGMMLGLHKPGHVHEYAAMLRREPGSAYTRNVTWLSIFITSTGISSWLGMPPPLGAASHIETITNLCKDANIPKWYRARAEIHRQTVQLVNSVDSKLDFRTRHSLIKIYEQELDRVKDLYDDVWNDDLEIEWQGARLYLFGIAFISPGPSVNSFHAESAALAAREVLQKGLAAAVGCLDTVANMKVPPTAEGENRCDVPDLVYQLGFYPKHFFRIGAFANFYLLWFLGVDTSASDQDKDLARTYITYTYRLLLSFTHSPEHHRAGQSIEALTRLPISAGKISQLRVHSRLGASFMYSYSLDGDLETNGSANSIPILGIDTVGPNGPAHPKLARAESETSPSTHTESTPQSSPHMSHDMQQQQPLNPHSQPLPQAQQPQAPQQQQPNQHHHPQHQQSSPGFQQQMPVQPTQQPQPPDPLGAPRGFPMPEAPGGPMQMPMFSDGTMLDPAMLATMNPNFEYPWGEWDPSVFNNIPMDMDPNQQYPMNQVDMGRMNLNDPHVQRSYT